MWMCQRGIKVVDGTKGTNELTLTWGQPRVTREAQCNTRGLRSGRRGPRNAVQEGLHWPLWALKMAEEATSQGMLSCQHLDIMKSETHV